MSEQSLHVPITLLNLPLADIDGLNHTLSDHLAQGPVLLTIYKSSCAASKVMLPMLDRINRNHKSHGLTTLAISQDSANITRSFARRYEIDYPLIVEGSAYPVSNGFEIRSTPSVYVVRPDGTVAYGTMGFMRDQIEEIEQEVARELGVQPVPIIGDDETEIPWFVPG